MHRLHGPTKTHLCRRANVPAIFWAWDVANPRTTTPYSFRGLHVRLTQSGLFYLYFFHPFSSLQSEPSFQNNPSSLSIRMNILHGPLLALFVVEHSDEHYFCLFPSMVFQGDLPGDHFSVLVLTSCLLKGFSSQRITEMIQFLPSVCKLVWL